MQRDQYLLNIQAACARRLLAKPSEAYHQDYINELTI